MLVVISLCLTAVSTVVKNKIVKYTLIIISILLSLFSVYQSSI